MGSSFRMVLSVGHDSIVVEIRSPRGPGRWSCTMDIGHFGTLENFAALRMQLTAHPIYSLR